MRNLSAATTVCRASGVPAAFQCSEAMGHWICIDHGTKRIGLAVGDTDHAIASPLKVVPAEPHSAAIEKIKAVADEYNADGVVVGWPLNMDDSEGPQAGKARAMAAELARLGLPDVRLWDERLSSFAADRVLAGMLTRKKRAAVQDAVAAAEILQDFFACGGPDSAPRPDEIPD